MRLAVFLNCRCSAAVSAFTFAVVQPAIGALADGPHIVHVLYHFRMAPLFVVTHFNHPKECTREAYDACRRLADAGVPISNQAVLLKGVNDDPKIFKELLMRLTVTKIWIL